MGGVRGLGWLAAGVLGTLVGAGATLTTSACELVCPPNCTGGNAGRTIELCEEAQDAYNVALDVCFGAEATPIDFSCNSYVGINCQGIDDYFACLVDRSEGFTNNCDNFSVDCTIEPC